MSRPPPASLHKDPAENFPDESEGLVFPHHMPRKLESRQQHQNADLWISELLHNRVTALESMKNVPVEFDFWALHRSLENSKIIVLEWMTTAAQSCPSARVLRKHYMKLAEHVVMNGAIPSSEVKEAAVNLEKRVEELQQYCQRRFRAEQISSCEAYFER